jgi:SAM-dependent methyltransferase
MERAEAQRRELDDCFVRALELIYLSSVPVQNILDFGCGLGGTVRLLREKLHLNAVGVDPFAEFTSSDFLHKVDLENLREIYPSGFFDAIFSIEVFEHLESPREIVEGLSYFLKPSGKILINTGTQEYLDEYDPERSYIDPVRRGHISIYSLKSLAMLADWIGMRARFLAERKYIVLLEPADESSGSGPHPANLSALSLCGGEWFASLMREYMRLVALEHERKTEITSMRQSFAMLQHEFDERGRWAKEQDQGIQTQREEITRLRHEFSERGRWAKEQVQELQTQREEIARLQAESEILRKALHSLEGHWNSQRSLLKRLLQRLLG